MNGIRSDMAPGFAQRDVRHPAAIGPYVRAGALLAELESPIDEAELRVDFQRACLHAQRSRLQRRSGMTVDDERAHAAPAELICEHQPGRAGTDDQNISIHGEEVFGVSRMIGAEIPQCHRTFEAGQFALSSSIKPNPDIDDACPTHPDGERLSSAT